MGTVSLAELPGMLGFAIGDSGGNRIESYGSRTGDEECIAIALVAANAFRVVGSLLQIGEASAVTSRSSSSSWVIGFNNGCCLAASIEPNAPTLAIEQALQSGEWVPKTEWEIDESEIEYEASRSAPVPAVKAAPARAATPKLPPSNKPSIAQKRMGEPVAPRRSPPVEGDATPAPRAASTKPVPTAEKQPPSLAPNDAKRLRLAVTRGDIKAISLIAEHLQGAPVSKIDPCGAGESAQAIPHLLAGIAAALSGDNHVAIGVLDAVTQFPSIGPTLNWAALIWSARASVGLSEGLDSALVYAESAARVAKQLDSESRAQSNRVLAEVHYHRKEPAEAERYVELSRRLLEPMQDSDGLAELFLLQARIALLRDNIAAAISAAEKARLQRSTWSEPVGFLCRCSLLQSKVDRAHTLVSELIGQGSATPDALRLLRLVEAVERDSISPTSAAEYLALEESPPSRSTVERLERLAKAAPSVDSISETLGWKYFRSGNFDAAGNVFAHLASKTDLPDDIHSSVLLALGCLATRGSHGKASVNKLRAVVDAAPKHLKSERPAARTSTQLRAAKPVDMADLEPPPSSLAYASPNDRALPGARAESTSHVFAGSLELFCLPDLLEFLRAGRRTGTLVCSSIRGIGAVQLNEGNLTGAIAPATPRFHELAVSDGILESKDIEAALTMRQRVDDTLPLGTFLVRQNKLKPSDLTRLLRHQIELAVAELLDWNEGHFSFEPESQNVAAKTHIEISVDSRSILLEIFKTRDERERHS